MSMITIVGNTTAPAELRYTPSGDPVANFTVAENHRKRSPSGEWTDDGATFWPCSVWGQSAENVAESLSEKGMRVVVSGRTKSRTFTTKDGQERTVLEVSVDEVGPSLRYASVRVTRTPRGDAGGGQPGGWPQTAQPTPVVANDPWANPQQDEVPF
jgi:single-strand DNA-binding protein